MGGLRNAIIWVGFLASTFVGAGFLLSDQPGRQTLGFVLLLAPLGILGALMALFYWKSRRQLLTEP